MKNKFFKTLKRCFSLGLAVVTVAGTLAAGSQINEVYAAEGDISYSVHQADIGDITGKTNGEIAGKTGQSKHLEAIAVNLSNEALASGENRVEYQVHQAGLGWSDWKTAGNWAGTRGQNRQIEAIRVRLQGPITEKYDVYYTSHVAYQGWMAWTKNGRISGSTGFGLSIEAIKIELVKKGGQPKEDPLYVKPLSEAQIPAPQKIEIVKSNEQPLMDPVGIMLKKEDATGTTPATGSLKGAQFEVKYYAEIMDTDPAKAGCTPVRTWVFETDEKGRLLYSENFKVSGDELYKNALGTPSLPYGTVTFQEIKAPEGYLVNDEIIVKKIDGMVESGAVVYQEPTQKEQPLLIEIIKTDAITGAKVAGVEFSHTGPDGKTRKYTTDNNGSVVISGLLHGKHTIVETKVPDGYAINTQEIEFTVSNDNKITITSGADTAETDTDGKVTLKVNSKGCLDGTVANKPAPYSIRVHKTNEKNKVLAGAEFTLYEDKACTKVVKTVTPNPVTTNASGDAKVNGLIVGKKYYMRETEAPKGYAIPKNKDGSDIIYEISATSRVSENKFVLTVNGKNYTSANGTIHVGGTKAAREGYITVINQTGKKLPATGSSMTLLLIGTGMVMVVIAAAAAKKREH